VVSGAAYPIRHYHPYHHYHHHRRRRRCRRRRHRTNHSHYNYLSNSLMFDVITVKSDIKQVVLISEHSPFYKVLIK
jgi:hypothetical protein